MIPYIRKLEKNGFEIILVFFIWFLNKSVALFALFKFLWNLFAAKNMFMFLDIFS